MKYKTMFQKRMQKIFYRNNLIFKEEKMLFCNTLLDFSCKILMWRNQLEMKSNNLFFKLYLEKKKPKPHTSYAFILNYKFSK